MMVFPSLSLVHCPLLRLFITSFYSIPLLPCKATDRQTSHCATLIAGVFDINCQNRPHCLISACDIFFLFFISPFCSIFFCVILLCQIPLLLSRGIFFLQMTDVNSPYEMGGSSPLTDFPVVSSFEPQSRVCVLTSTVVFQAKAAAGSSH